MAFVHWLENVPPYADQVQAIFERSKERGDRLCTSAFTIGELLVGPEKRGDTELQKQLLRVLPSEDFTVFDFTSATAAHYGTIRATYRVTASDAIHLACAMEHRVDLFLTNDQSLRKLVLPGISFIDGFSTSLLG